MIFLSMTVYFFTFKVFYGSLFLLIPSAIFKAKDIRFENMEKLKMWSLSDCLPKQVAPINGKKNIFMLSKRLGFNSVKIKINLSNRYMFLSVTV